MKPNIFATILLGMLLVTAKPFVASADSFHNIATQAWTKYTAAQASWQRGLAELVMWMNPRFREIATVQRDLQLASIERSTARFRYLLEHDPHRIVLTNGVSHFANFEWTDTDTELLTESDPAYAQLQKRIMTLKKKNDEKSDWPEFRAWFRDTLSRSKDYEALLSDFQAKGKAVEDLLGR